MATQTVAEITTSRKSPTAFYAILDEANGALTKVGGVLYFIAEDGTIIEITPAHINFLVVLGEMLMSDGQRIADLMAGGYAGVACSRMEGVWHEPHPFP
jgi:hypothetical protein